jgi:hypothetical protein
MAEIDMSVKGHKRKRFYLYLYQPIRRKPKHIRLHELSYEIYKVLGHNVELLNRYPCRPRDLQKYIDWRRWVRLA